ncbi:MAG: iron-containing alcohol dehydrogenase family protein [Halapricum sp.]
MERFRFAYEPSVIRAGRGCVSELADELDRQGVERALVVCGSTVGSTRAVIDPVTDGLGERLAGVFAGTTTEKRLETAFDALAAYREHDADALVGLGGGSSLDVAKVTAVLAGTDREPRDIGRELRETGSISVPADPAPIVAVPTTLTGADLSQGAGVTAAPSSGLVEEPASGGVSAPSLMPRAVVADPDLVATTPKPVLAASAMNGFDKGLETLYAATATPITDATASRGLEVLGGGLQAFADGELDAENLAPVVEGLVLVQYGISRPDGGTLSLIHAFGHGLTRSYEVQQGAAHAVVAPHVLRYLFEKVDARRDLLAGSLGVGAASDPASAVVERVSEIRNALGLPTRLRDVDGPDPAAFETVAEAILADSIVDNAPRDLDPTADEIEGVLQSAY